MAWHVFGLLKNFFRKGKTSSGGLSLHNASNTGYEQIDLEKELRITNTLLSSIPGFIYRCCIDRHWTMTFLSNGFEGITGYDRNDVLKNRRLSFNDIVHPDHRKRLHDEWETYLQKEAILQEIVRAAELEKPGAGSAFVVPVEKVVGVVHRFHENFQPSSG